MQVDEQFHGLTNRLQHFAIPVSDTVADTFTTMLMDVQHGRMALIEYQQSTADRDGNVEARISSIRNRYDVELTQAQAQAQECAAAAWASHANAEKYAQMTAVLGAAATNELQERDRTIMGLTHEYCTLTEMTLN